MEKREPSYIVGWNVSWYSYYGGTVWRLLKKLKLKLPYDPVVSLLGIFPEKTVIRKDKCTPIFIAVLFTAASTWKQPKCPSMEE